MLRIHLMQQGASLSDPAMEDALIEVPVMRRFAGIDIMSERILEETTILAFGHLLGKHDLGQKIFEAVKAHLKSRGMAMKQGTIIDATLIAAPTSTKNKQGEREPKMHQTQKGNQWLYGMKVQISVDAESGLIHSLHTTAANVHELAPAAELLHGEDTVVCADAGYQGIAKRPEMADKAIAMVKAHIRAKGEHPFQIVKQQSSFQKTRLRGVAKNRCKVHVLVTLANLFMTRHLLLEPT